MLLVGTLGFYKCRVRKVNAHNVFFVAVGLVGGVFLLASVAA
jgi:hypothetical protein